MFDSKKELLDGIRLGESTFLELKEVRFSGDNIIGPNRDSLADELSAFANGRGGVCLLGVEDRHREVLGIPVDRLAKVETFVRQICNDSIEPSIDPVIEPLELPTLTGDNVAIIKIEVAKSLYVHQSPRGYFYRIGSSKRRMSPDYLLRLSQQRDQTRFRPFDEQIVTKSRLEDLDPDLCDQFRTPLTEDSRSGLLSKLHMIRVDRDGELKPTVAGVLMASSNPRQWLANAYIQAVSYRGRDIRISGDPQHTYQLDAADIGGPLDHQITGACQFVFKNMKIRASKHHGRIDRPQFDMTAVFEAIVNAVIHRDYSIYGSKIRLRMFEDRLEIYSPGTISNAMTIDSLAHLQSTRNEVITSLLAKRPVPDLPYLDTDRRTMTDKRGEGVPVIIDRSKELSDKLPEYRLFDEAELMLTIYAPED